MNIRSFLDRLVGADDRILATATAACIALAVLVPRASVPALFVVFAYQAVAALRRRAFPPLNMPVIAGLAALIVWSYLSTFWALASTIGPTTRLLLMLAVGFFVFAWANERAAKDTSLGTLCIGFSVAFTIYVFESISWAWLTRTLHSFAWRDILDDDVGGIAVKSLLINGTTILSLFMWPTITGFWISNHRRRALILFVAVALLVIAFGSESGLIAMILGLLTWWLVSCGGQTIVKALSILFVVVVLATPFASSRVLTNERIDRVVNEVPHVPTSALVRLKIWQFTVERISERPLAGWGFDAARRIPQGGEKFTLKDAAGRAITTELNLPLHPHNQILQIWLELGAVGAIIVALTGAVIIVQIGRLPLPARNGSLALMTSVLVFDNLSYGAWQSWWIAEIILAAAVQVAMNSLSKNVGPETIT